MAQHQRLAAATEAWRRRRAIDLHPAGWTGRALAAALGVGPSAVPNWLRHVRAGGLDAVRARRQQTGKRPKLTAAQQHRLLTLLSPGAEAQGEIGERWTGKRVAALIQREVGVVYHPAYLPRLLGKLGWSRPQPGKEAPQRNAAQVAHLKAEWAAVKQGRTPSSEPSCG